MNHDNELIVTYQVQSVKASKQSITEYGPQSSFYTRIVVAHIQDIYKNVNKSNRVKDLSET
jgi:hypothetical protein